MAEFRMPSLGADMDFGRVVEWLVKPGDRVDRGQIIVEIETDKGTFEVESPSTGLVGELAVTPGSKVAVGTILTTIAGDGTEAPIPAPRTAAAAPLPPPPRPEPAAPAPPAAAIPPGRTRASPAARKLAAEHGVDLDAIEGTGPDHAVTIADIERALRVAPVAPEAPEAPGIRISPVARRMAQALGIDTARLRGTGVGGTITKADVEAAAPARPAPVPPPPSMPPEAPPTVQLPEAIADASRAAMRRAIAAAVSRSKREIPHYYLGTDIDLTSALAWLEQRNRERPVAERVLPSVLLLKAVATALRRFPDLNGFWTDAGFQPSGAIHVGAAISLRGGGLIVPAIHDTDRRTIDELMLAARDLVARARSGGLRGSEMTDATVTVTSLGDEGASTVFGVIYPPQVAVIGFGRIAERAWAEKGMLAARRVVTATLAADHRATDGRYGGLFLAELDRLLHAPDSL